MWSLGFNILIRVCILLSFTSFISSLEPQLGSTRVVFQVFIYQNFHIFFCFTYNCFNQFIYSKKSKFDFNVIVFICTLLSSWLIGKFKLCVHFVDWTYVWYQSEYVRITLIHGDFAKATLENHVGSLSFYPPWYQTYILGMSENLNQVVH
jgi:hypothetical protein